MAFFLAIVASHLTGIVGGPVLLTFNSIVFCCQGGFFFLFKLLPPLLLVIGLDGLIGTGRRRGFAVS